MNVMTGPAPYIHEMHHSIVQGWPMLWFVKKVPWVVCVRPTPSWSVERGAQAAPSSAGGQDPPDRRPADPQPPRDLRVAHPLGLEPDDLLGLQRRRPRAAMGPA